MSKISIITDKNGHAFIEDLNENMTDRESLGLLYKISMTFMESLDINITCENIMESLFEHIEKIDGGAIIISNMETGKTEPLISRTRNNFEDYDINYNSTIVEKVLTEGNPLIVTDTNSEDEKEVFKSMMTEKKKSVMCIPLSYKSRILGVIYVQSMTSVNGFNNQDLQLFSAFSAPAALAIEKALIHSRLRQADEKIQKAHENLESRIKNSTEDLLRINKQLWKEVDDRMKAEEDLNTAHEKLKDANRRLQLAYSLISQEKDRLSSRLQGTSKAILMNQKGQILGVTDKVLECTGMSRMQIIGNYIYDLVDEESKKELIQEINKANKGLLVPSTFHKICIPSDSEGYEATLLLLNTKKEKLLLLLG